MFSSTYANVSSDPSSLSEITMVDTALTCGQSDKLIQIQTPVDELTTSGKRIKSVSVGYVCVIEVRRCIRVRLTNE